MDLQDVQLGRLVRWSARSLQLQAEGHVMVERIDGTEHVEVVVVQRNLDVGHNLCKHEHHLPPKVPPRAVIEQVLEHHVEAPTLRHPVVRERLLPQAPTTR